MEARFVSALPQVWIWGGNFNESRGPGIQSSTGRTIGIAEMLGGNFPHGPNGTAGSAVQQVLDEGKRRIDEMHAQRIAEEQAAAAPAFVPVLSGRGVIRRAQGERQEALRAEVDDQKKQAEMARQCQSNETGDVASILQHEVNFVLDQLKLEEGSDLLTEIETLRARLSEGDVLSAEARTRLCAAVESTIGSVYQAYLRFFYRDYDRFPEASKLGAIKAIRDMGAMEFDRQFRINEVEILISDSMLTTLGSQFGHVAVSIGGVVYGRAQNAWDIRSKERYLRKQQDLRRTVGHVILLMGDQKQKLFESITRKIVEDRKYSVLNHSCSGEVISSFAELGVSMMDPRWTIGDVFSPADIDNYLRHSPLVTRVDEYRTFDEIGRAKLNHPGKLLPDDVRQCVIA